MARFSRMLVLASIVGFGALLGGCGVSKEEHQKSLDEAKELRAKVDEAESRDRQEQAKIAELERNNNQLQQQLASKPAPPTGPTGGDERTPPKEPVAKEGVRIDLGTNLFNPGSDVLTAAAKKQLDTTIASLKKKHPGASFRVEGYADKTPPSGKGKFKTNEALSQARADTVRKYMSSKGLKNVEAVGMGAVTAHGKAPSRRVEIVVIG